MATNKVGLRDNPDPPEYAVPVCPVCGRECEKVFFDSDYDIIGCDECISEKSAYEVEACFPKGDQLW